MKLVALILAGLLAGAVAAGRGFSAEMLVVGPSAPPGVEGLPAGWQHIPPSKTVASTRYRMVREADADVLQAESRGSASSLYRPLEVNPAVYRVVTWRWKIQKVLAKADAPGKIGSDHPAQVFVKFRYDRTKASLWERTTYWAYRTWYGEYPHAGVLHYVWDRRLPRGTAHDVPDARKERVIVVRSGPEDTGRWVKEERNLYEDYRQAFGREPFPIAGVGVMTDTDEAGETAVAWYGQIVLRTVK